MALALASAGIGRSDVQIFTRLARWYFSKNTLGRALNFLRLLQIDTPENELPKTWSNRYLKIPARFAFPFFLYFTVDLVLQNGDLVSCTAT